MAELYKRIVTEEPVPIPTSPSVTFELSMDASLGDGSVSTVTLILEEGTTELNTYAVTYNDYYGFCWRLNPTPYVYWEAVTNSGPTDLYDEWRVGDEYNFGYYFDSIISSEVPIYDNNGLTLYSPGGTEEVIEWKRVRGGGF